MVWIFGKSFLSVGFALVAYPKISFIEGGRSWSSELLAIIELKKEGKRKTYRFIVLKFTITCESTQIALGQLAEAVLPLDHRAQLHSDVVSSFWDFINWYGVFTKKHWYGDILGCVSPESAGTVLMGVRFGGLKMNICKFFYLYGIISICISISICAYRWSPVMLISIPHVKVAGIKPRCSCLCLHRLCCVKARTIFETMSSQKTCWCRVLNEVIVWRDCIFYLHVDFSIS